MQQFQQFFSPCLSLRVLIPSPSLTHPNFLVTSFLLFYPLSTNTNDIRPPPHLLSDCPSSAAPPTAVISLPFPTSHSLSFCYPEDRVCTFLYVPVRSSRTYKNFLIVPTNVHRKKCNVHLLVSIIVNNTTDGMHIKQQGLNKYKYTAKVTRNKRCHMVQQNAKNQTTDAQTHPLQGNVHLLLQTVSSKQ